MNEVNEHFDHVIGEQHSTTDTVEAKMLSRIIKAHAEDYKDEERMNFQRIGLHLRMKRYLEESTSQIVSVGDFLSELLTIYQVKKTKFAELIDYESSNLHAILKGRRRLNNKLATKIGAIFSIEPHLWMYIDAKNELTKFQRENDIADNRYTLDQLKLAR